MFFYFAPLLIKTANLYAIPYTKHSIRIYWLLYHTFLYSNSTKRDKLLKNCFEIDTKRSCCKYEQNPKITRYSKGNRHCYDYYCPQPPFYYERYDGFPTDY